MRRGPVLFVLALALALTWPPAARAQSSIPDLTRTFTFNFPAGASLKSTISFIADSAGLGANFETSFTDTKTTSPIDLRDVTGVQALDTVLPANALFYKVIGPAAVLVIPENPQNRQKYEEGVIKTVPLASADATELATMLTSLLGSQGSLQPRPQVQANKGANTITIRGGAPMVALAERIIAANDRAKAEVRIDLSFLEVDRAQSRTNGLFLSTLIVGLQYAPVSTRTSATTSGTQVDLPTLLGGFAPTDFTATVPSAVIKFLESDSHTRVLAKPSLRGEEGTALSVKFGDDVPVPSTTFQSLAAPGSSATPIGSFTYRTVGLSVSTTTRVTPADDIILDMEFEASAVGSDITVSGQSLPSFLVRKAKTRLRLHSGDSGLLAGVIYDDDRGGTAGISGLARIPLLKQLFSANDSASGRKEVLVLVTPHVVRPRPLAASDLQPVVIRQP